MVAVGMLLIWGGYSVSLWGWCLIRNYNVTMGQLTSPLHPYGSGKNQPWPPASIPATQIWPGSNAAAATPSGGSSSPCRDGSTPNQTTGRCADGSTPVVSGTVAM